MGLQIKADVLQALNDWNAGKAVRSLELGHIHQMEEHPGLSPRVNYGKRLQNDQERAHAYCFSLIDQLNKNDWNGTHEEFLQMCEANAAIVMEQGLTEEERIGAESLAWKALLVGWRKAIDGHKDADYIEVKNSAAVAA